VRRHRGAGRRLPAPPVWAASMPRTTNAPAARFAGRRAKGFRHAAAPPASGAARSGDGRCVGRAADDVRLNRRLVCGPPRRRASRAGGCRSECGPSRTVQDGRQAVWRRRRRRRRCAVPLCTRRGRRVGGAARHGRGAPRLAGGTSSGRSGGRATGECPGAPGRGDALSCRSSGAPQKGYVVLVLGFPFCSPRRVPRPRFWGGWLRGNSLRLAPTLFSPSQGHGRQRLWQVPHVTRRQSQNEQFSTLCLLDTWKQASQMSSALLLAFVALPAP